MTNKEVMQMALDAIETYSPEYMHGLPKKDYVNALRMALAQREWVGLTDKDIEALGKTWGGWAPSYIKDIEAKLKEKNNGR